MIIKGEDQDSIQNTCNTKHNNPPARTVIPSHLKSLNTYPMNALMNWNSRLIGFWNWMTIHWVSGRLQCKWPQWHQKRIKPTWSRITELNIHTDGLQTSADQSRGGVGGVMESRIFFISTAFLRVLWKVISYRQFSYFSGYPSSCVIHGNYRAQGGKSVALLNQKNGG